MKLFDLDTGKVVSRRIIGDELPYPDRVIKCVNQWGKTTRGEKYSDGIEFCNRKRESFDWENEELAETLPIFQRRHRLAPDLARQLLVPRA